MSGEATSSPFRPQALEFHRRGGLRGDVLHITPDLLRAVFWLLLALVLCLLAFAVTAQLTDYASGPALVSLDGRSEVTASRAGTVAEVATRVGAQVREGDVLLRLHAATEAAELASLERELQDQLVLLMGRPTDRAAKAAVLDLRTRRDVARSALERSLLRAPCAGEIADLRARPGQMIQAGAPVLAIQADPRGASITALLPGPERPLLRAGMPLHLQVDGFQRSALELAIERVDAQVLGPPEALRAIGSELEGAFEVRGPVVLVHARVPSGGFESEGVQYRLHHGMAARAEVAVRRKPLLYAFLPGLEEALGDVF